VHNISVKFNNDLNEKVYVTKLDNGLSVYLCKKEGYKQKIGMFGTKYGSLTNHFVDINSGKEITVPDGVAHFLEHKLFENKDENALDLFSKIGVDSNAYTTYDHTVFYFNTTNKLNESVKMLIKLIKEPYFTDENIKKEQGIIAQEIMMYKDDPYYNTYFNAIKAMYKENNIRVDVLGSVESISKITKQDLYNCYNTFYNLNNMFFILVGDIDIEKSIELIENELKKYTQNDLKVNEIKKFYKKEPDEINKERIEEKMKIFMPQICIGYKLKPVCGKNIIKRALLTDIISDMYFSKMTDFFQNEYEKEILNDKIYLSYEAENSFSHIIFSAESLKLDLLESDLIDYINDIKTRKIDEKLFTQVKNNKIGAMILSSDYISNSYRRIIDSILTDTDIYEDLDIIKKITVDDVYNFLSELKDDKKVISITNKY
jgi:predicted Zn-dependent peptidase